MAEAPQVYRAGKVQRLEFHRDRLEKASKRDRGRLALDQERAIHEVLVEMARDQDVLIKEVKAMKLMVQGMVDKLNGVGR